MVVLGLIVVCVEFSVWVVDEDVCWFEYDGVMVCSIFGVVYIVWYSYFEVFIVVLFELFVLLFV